MRMSYNRLWKLLIDKNMKKSDLRKIAGVSSSSLAKLSKGENVTTDVILKICSQFASRLVMHRGFLHLMTFLNSTGGTG